MMPNCCYFFEQEALLTLLSQPIESLPGTNIILQLVTNSTIHVLHNRYRVLRMWKHDHAMAEKDYVWVSVYSRTSDPKHPDTWLTEPA